MTLYRHSLFAAALVGLFAGVALADEAAIRKNLAERLPRLPKIDEVSKTPLPGVYEVRMGTELFYTDEQGDHVLQGHLIDTRNKTDLTQLRIDKLSAIDFATLPLKDAMVIKQGNGSRKLAVFADPNCGYCKRFERDLLKVKDVTIYTFLYPVLGPDSEDKARSIWCSKDAAKTWRAWMVDGTTVPRTMGQCDTAAIERNTAFGQKYRITGTPALLFQNGKRMPGAISTAEVEKLLDEAATAPKS
jgi:thiol:disulfide interchange protein DsbC